MDRSHDDTHAESGRFSPDTLNERYALVIIGGRPMVLDECWKDHVKGGPHRREGMRFLTIDAFEKWHANNLVRIGDRQYSVATLWLKHPDRRQYQGLYFDPAALPGGADNGGFYNLWQSFSVEADETASCSIFLDHLRTNVANGDDELYRYILAWMAHLVQRPAERIGIALVLRGRQGTGKTLVGQVIGRLIEGNYALVDDPRFIVGNFNAHMASLLLLQADEGFWAGDKHAEGRLKGLVTSDRQMIEMKGKDPVQVSNFIRLLVTSNSEWVVPAGHEERRFAVLDVGEHCMQNHTYFAEMMTELEKGGYGALLHHLLNFDLGSVDLRKIPATAALAEQKIASLGPVEAWWFTCLGRGWIVTPDGDQDDNDPWPDEIAIERVHGSYVGYCDRLGIRHKKFLPQFGIELRRLVRELSRGRSRTPTGRVYVYRLPPLDECRKEFETLLRTAINWETGDFRPLPSPDVEEG